jgi:hypothetical protein
MTTYMPLFPEHVICCVVCQCITLYDVEVKITDKWRNIMGVEVTCGLSDVPAAA